jgi:hypothetical protein
LTTVTEDKSGADEVPNNPAGRVLIFLRAFEQAANRDPGKAAILTVSEMLGEERESAPMYLLLTRLRMEAESVEGLMAPYASVPGYKTIFKHYGQILDATKRLQVPFRQNAHEIFTSVNDAGWAALEYADDVLTRSSTEKRLPAALRDHYLDDLRTLIDEVVADDTLSPQDRQRVVGLLRQVEDALVHIRLFGADRVEDAVAAAAAVIHSNPSLRSRIANKKWAKKLGVLVVGLLFTLAEDAGRAAIEQAFGTEDKPQFVAQQDRQGQPTEQPTSR